MYLNGCTVDYVEMLLEAAGFKFGQPPGEVADLRMRFLRSRCKTEIRFQGFVDLGENWGRLAPEEWRAFLCLWGRIRDSRRRGNDSSRRDEAIEGQACRGASLRRGCCQLWANNVPCPAPECPFRRRQGRYSLVILGRVLSDWPAPPAGRGGQGVSGPPMVFMSWIAGRR